MYMYVRGKTEFGLEYIMLNPLPRQKTRTAANLYQMFICGLYRRYVMSLQVLVNCNALMNLVLNDSCISVTVYLKYKISINMFYIIGSYLLNSLPL